MQITLTLSPIDSVILPIASSRSVQGMIYSALREDSRYSFELHENGNEYLKRSYKLFNFSEIKGAYEIRDKSIIYRSDIKIVIRSADPYFIRLLTSFFNKNSEVNLGYNQVRVSDVRLEDKQILTPSVRVKTLSPITVYSTESDGHTVYYSPEQAEFYDAVTGNARRKTISGLGSDDGFDFSIAPCEGARFVKRATRFKDTFITAWHGQFWLEGSLETLNFLYQTGLGSKNSQGFGMFEVVE